MINLLSIKCNLGFAPYLDESLRAFAQTGMAAGRVVRQGGSAFIIRTADELMLRHRGQEVELGLVEVNHYLAALDFRIAHFNVTQHPDEIIFASVAGDLYLSHPQSEIWLSAETVLHLVETNQADLVASSTRLPDWLTISKGGGRLLISDQRSGRWVLLAEEHIADLENRVDQLSAFSYQRLLSRPPVITIKGVIVHLQSAFRLAQTLESFIASGEVAAYEDRAPDFALHVARSTEGIEIKDFDTRAGLTVREARKWAELIRYELENLKAVQFARGKITTVIADSDQGRWFLQGGDEVLVTPDARAQLASGADAQTLITRKTSEFFLLVNPHNGNCVVLDPREAEAW